MQEQIKDKINRISVEIQFINEKISLLNNEELKLEKEIEENKLTSKRESLLPNAIGFSFFGWLSVVSPSLFLKFFFLGFNISNFVKLLAKIKRNEKIDKIETEKAITLMVKKVQLMQTSSKIDNLSKQRFCLMDEIQQAKQEIEI